MLEMAYEIRKYRKKKGFYNTDTLNSIRFKRDEIILSLKCLVSDI